MPDNNLTPEELFKLAGTLNSKENDGKQAEVLKDMLMKKLSPEQSKTLNTLLNDKPSLDKLLATEQAKQLMEKLMGNK